MQSRAIRTFSYDEQSRTLFVTFVDGDLYAYRGVEAQTHAALAAALSKGRFFARRIRGRYAYAKVGEDGRAVFTPADGTGVAMGR